MNFDLDEDQALLKATVERFVADRYAGDLERRRGYRREAAGFAAANWARLADTGLVGLSLPASHGGIAAGWVELAVAHEALARGLVVEPLLEVGVIAAGMLHAAGNAAQQDKWLARVASGAAHLALAHSEPSARYNLAHIETIARPRGADFLLSGHKINVAGGAAVDALIVGARTSGPVRDRDGIAFFLVPHDAAGMHIRRYALADGSLAAEVRLHDVVVPAAARLASGLDALEVVAARARFVAAAEMLGLASLLFETTLAYVKTRRQFGRALGDFQVVQHRLADCFVAVEQARSMVWRTALSGENARAAAACKAFVGEVALRVGHEAVQLHGGMGVTEELLVGHALKRIRVLALTFGDGDTALADYARAA